MTSHGLYFLSVSIFLTLHIFCFLSARAAASLPPLKLQRRAFSSAVQSLKNLHLDDGVVNDDFDDENGVVKRADLAALRNPIGATLVSSAAPGRRRSVARMDAFAREANPGTGRLGGRDREVYARPSVDHLRSLGSYRNEGFSPSLFSDFQNNVQPKKLPLTSNCCPEGPMLRMIEGKTIVECGFDECCFPMQQTFSGEHLNILVACRDMDKELQNFMAAFGGQRGK